MVRLDARTKALLSGCPKLRTDSPQNVLGLLRIEVAKIYPI